MSFTLTPIGHVRGGRADAIEPEPLITHLVQPVKEKEGRIAVQKVLNLFDSNGSATAVEVAVMSKEMLQSSLCAIPNKSMDDRELTALEFPISLDAVLSVSLGDTAVFRIGAAQSEDPAAHNDLVLSDAARAISRREPASGKSAASAEVSPLAICAMIVSP